MNIIGAAFKTVLLPVHVAVDVVTLGGVIYGEDRPSTVKALESISDDLEE